VIFNKNAIIINVGKKKITKRQAKEMSKIGFTRSLYKSLSLPLAGVFPSFSEGKASAYTSLNHNSKLINKSNLRICLLW